MNNIKNILIHAPNWLGDIIMSIPAMTLIREKYKESKITILIKSSMSKLFFESDIVDDIIELKRFLHLRKYGFNMAILFPNSFISALRVFGHGIKKRVGYSGDFRDFMLTDIADRKSVRWIHTSDYYVNMLKIIGIDSNSPKVTLHIGDTAKNIAFGYLKNVNPYGKKIFAYGIGATNSLGKIWDESYFASVANSLSRKYDALTLFVTTPNEKDIADRISLMLDRKPIVPYFGLDVISAILSLCDGFIGNDSGAMHLAYAVGIPTLALYFATPSYQNSPRGERSDFIEKKIECAFCGGRKCDKTTFECRKVIKPEEVIEKFENMLKNF